MAVYVISDKELELEYRLILEDSFGTTRLVGVAHRHICEI